MKETLTKWGTPVVALAVAVVFLVLGFRNYSMQKNFTPVTAVVSDVEWLESADPDVGDRTQVVHVTYVIGGKTYNEVLQYNSADLQVGETLTVKYDPDKPTYVTAANTKTTAAYIGLGIAFLAAAVFTIIRAVKE